MATLLWKPDWLVSDLLDCLREGGERASSDGLVHRCGPGAAKRRGQRESWQQRALNELPFLRRTKHSDEAEGPSGDRKSWHPAMGPCRAPGGETDSDVSPR